MKLLLKSGGSTPVYQKSTKKAPNRLYCSRLGDFHILGRLPSFYHLNFFTSNSPVFRISSPFLQPSAPRKERDTGVAGRKRSKTSKYLGKTEKSVSK